MALLPPERRDRRSSMFLEAPTSVVQYDGSEVPQIARARTLPQNKFLNRKATFKNEIPSSQPQDAATGPAKGVPSLTTHPFHNCDKAGAEVSVEVAVLFMYGGDDDKSPCSIFSTKDTEQSSGSPNIAVDQTNQLSETDLVREQKEMFDLQAKISGILESQAKKNLSDIQKQRAALFDHDTRLLQSGIKHIEKTEAPNAPQRPKTGTKEVNWLKQNDMLPSLIPEGRIMGYGFGLGALKAKLDFKAAASMFAQEFNKLSGYSEKPIVLIGHGYGNTVIEALLCSGDEESEAFKRLTTAVILLLLQHQDQQN